MCDNDNLEAIQPNYNDYFHTVYTSLEISKSVGPDTINLVCMTLYINHKMSASTGIMYNRVN